MSKKEYVPWTSGVGVFESERTVSAKDGEREARPRDASTGGQGGGREAGDRGCDRKPGLGVRTSLSSQ